jgi:nucleotide-binding universal stress UspA family protein
MEQTETVFRNILLPIDDSDQSMIAQQMTVFFAKLFKSQVTLMHVVPNEPVSLPDENFPERENYAPIGTAAGQFPRTLKAPSVKEYSIPDEVAKEISEGYISEGQSVLTQSARIFSQEGITAKERLIEGADTAQTIITEADTGNYDLIIMANSSREDKKQDLQLGSAAEKISSNVKIPFLIVRQKSEVKKILIPIEGSEKEELAVQKASSIARAANSQVILLHVQEDSLFKLKPEPKEKGSQILNVASQKLEGIPIEQKLLLGDPATLIIQISKEADVDLIVMGRGHGRLRDSSIGSVSKHVLHHASVPVLVIK